MASQRQGCGNRVAKGVLLGCRKDRGFRVNGVRNLLTCMSRVTVAHLGCEHFGSKVFGFINLPLMEIRFLLLTFIHCLNVPHKTYNMTICQHLIWRIGILIIQRPRNSFMHTLKIDSFIHSLSRSVSQLVSQCICLCAYLSVRPSVCSKCTKLSRYFVYRVFRPVYWFYINTKID